MQHEIHKIVPKEFTVFPLEKYQIIQIATFLYEETSSLVSDNSDVKLSITTSSDSASSSYSLDEFQKFFSATSSYSTLEFYAYVYATGIQVQIFASAHEISLFISSNLHTQPQLEDRADEIIHYLVDLFSDVQACRLNNYYDQTRPHNSTEECSAQVSHDWSKTGAIWTILGVLVSAAIAVATWLW